jgi:hypothetical protein
VNAEAHAIATTERAAAMIANRAGKEPAAIGEGGLATAGPVSVAPTVAPRAAYRATRRPPRALATVLESKGPIASASSRVSRAQVRLRSSRTDMLTFQALDLRCVEIVALFRLGSFWQFSITTSS